MRRARSITPSPLRLVRGNGVAIATPKPAIGRGVWEAPYLIAGLPVLVAIDSAGNRVAETAVDEGMYEVEQEILSGLLERKDPSITAPRLSLVP